jgi:predicted nucleotidyltransferase
MTEQDTLMVAGKARWLLEGGADELDDGERALLLALASLEIDTGRTVTAEEREALDRIAARSEVDGDEIARAVKHMIEAEAKKDHRLLDWSVLKKRFRRD